MIAMADAGCRAIAPDLMGCGLSEHHPEPAKAYFNNFVEDPLAIFTLTRILGVVSLGVPFFVPRPQRYRDLPEGAWEAEANFRRFDVKTIWRNIYILFSRSEIPKAEKGKEIMDLVDPSNPLPAWLNDEDFTIYAKAYESSGFSSPMQVPYTGLREEFTVENPKVEVPVLLIVGGKDYFLNFPGIEDYITSGKVRDYVAELEIGFLFYGTRESANCQLP
ncbi:hypothetical protein CRYUN_Cryun37aG0111000 [Craigia yunnanensis]